MPDTDGRWRPGATLTNPDDAHLVNLLGAFVCSLGDRLASALADEPGCGGTDAAAVLSVDTWPDCSIDFLARIVGLTHSGAVRLVDRLESTDLLQRGPGGDKRTAALRLTRSGQALAGRLRQRRSSVLSQVVAQADPAERAVLSRVLDRALRRTPRSRMEARRECRLCDHAVCVGDECPVGSSVDE